MFMLNKLFESESESDTTIGDVLSRENFRNNTEYRVYLHTISRYKYVMSKCYISEI